MRTGKRKRLWALLLSAALIVTQLPAVAMAENNTPEDGAIASFDPLDSSVANQTVDVGTELSALDLPDVVTASVYHVTEDMVIPNEDGSGEDSTDESDDTATASPSDAENSVSGNSSRNSSTKDSGKTVTTVTTSEEKIPVTWDSDPAYDGDTEGSYLFTADVGGYSLSSNAELPQITVTVGANTAENPTVNPPAEPLPCTKTEGCTLEDGHEGECGANMLLADPDAEYDPGDVAVINGIIDRSTLDWTKDDPGSWNTIDAPVDGAPFLTWSSGSPKRITELCINNVGLSGTLDVSHMTDLQVLVCSQNSLSGLNASGLTNLQLLNFWNNPFQSLKLPDGNTLTLGVIPADGGMVSVDSYDLTNKTVTLTAVPEQGHMFTAWSGDAAGRDNPNNITLNSDKHIIAYFSRVGSNVYVGDTDVAVGGYWKGDGSGGLNACGDTDSWTVSYAPATHVLTLRDADIKSPASPTTYSACIDAYGDLTIELIGDSTIDAENMGKNGMYVRGDLSITGGGRLTVTGGPGEVSNGVLVAGNLIQEGGTLEGKGGAVSSSVSFFSVGVYAKNIILRSGTLTGTGSTATSRASSLGVRASNGIAVEGGVLTGTGDETTGSDNSYSAGVFVDQGTITVNGGTLTATGGEADAESYGVYADGLLISQGTVIAQSLDPSGTAQAFSNEPTIDPAYTAARVWYGMDENEATNRGQQPASVLTENYTEKYVKIGELVPIPVQYTVNVSASPSAGGTVNGGGTFTENTSVTVNASVNSGYQFVEWRENNAQVSKDSSYTFSLTGSRNLVAVFREKGGGSSSGGSYAAPEPQSYYRVTGEPISLPIPRPDLRRLADAGKTLTIEGDNLKMTFDPAALKAILAAVPATAGNVTFTAAPADLSAFPDAAKQIGAHPAYDFTISYKDGNGNPATVPVNFPAGSASISLNYTPAAAEITGSLFMVYVDGEGAVTWLDKSSYDNGKVLSEVPHFSTYGVTYKEPAPVFTDITGHWAKEDIEFVAARGLLSGKVNDAEGGREAPLGDTGNNLFSPDGAMTRGMFVTALGRLAGVNPDSYHTRSFTDVKADAYYAAYVEWAAQKNIVKRTGEGLFSPDAPVTREQMAVMMVNYAGQMGYSIPAPLAAVTFTDNANISAWAAKEVAAMQRAGIVRSKDGNRFDPQGNATRAEVSAVLRRFVEIVIDPATATGWVKNDSGHWLYYKGGTALTGWQTIGKLRYFFNADGVMHEGWKQDTSTDKWYYWTNAGAVTGWREIDGKWYYFDENGVMAVNTKIDGYEVGPDGAWKDYN